MSVNDYDRFYEYIIVGCGGVGSGALYWLSKQAGKDVLGLEQFKLGHHNGGSQDLSRVVRHSYPYEKYTKLTREQFKAWYQVEEEAGLKLVINAGTLDMAKKDSDKAEKVTLTYQAALKQNVRGVELWNGATIRKRYPQWTVGDDVIGVYIPEGGIVDAALANSTHVQLATKHGATVIDECPVQKIIPTEDGGVVVHTPKGRFKCRRLIVTAGAWINHVLNSVGVKIPVKVTQEQVTYFATPNIKDFTPGNFPGGWSFQLENLTFYGMAIHGNSYSKIGIDAGGQPVTPETRNFIPDPKREKQCIDFFSKYAPEALGPISFTKTCLYAMTYDRDFVIDSLADRNLPQVIVCCGAGHAFKWASFLGKVLAEMAVNGKTQYDISAFKFDRPAVTDPNFEPHFYYGIGKSSKM